MLSKIRNFVHLTRPISFQSILCTPVRCNSTIPVEEIEKSVFISQSADVYSNLALEDWFYRHEDFNKHRPLLLWKNSPTVVIGRHQNIWTEVDMPKTEKYNINIVRRNSGGGTVYHDEGNLNCSFFTTRKDYNRKFNLGIIQRALQRLGFEVEINCKDDLTLNGFKISGTASKLGKNAYHHCTLLVDSDLQTLSSLLNPVTEGIESRATKSKKSPVTNLKQHNQGLTFAQVLVAVGSEFLRTDAKGTDRGEEFAKKQRGYQLVNPTEEWFPGLDAFKSQLKSWEWNSGKTPEFTVSKSIPFPLPSSLGSCTVEFKVIKGIVQSCSASFPLDIAPDSQNQLMILLKSFEGNAYHPQILEKLETWSEVADVPSILTQ